ncbi:aromatic amino acid DMT transporter YddG [uncultured Massilia sp.]|uniref:aromatic amino acid DMT transporter YddG n=1 Tax=uncultured Massilia sp. TaxID=169973 RepID=UPI0025F71F7C|nr:aromatic amino acid DMT transporter YddG [uncultured Massilia sp.]
MHLPSISARSRATLVGLLAIVFWSSLVGLLRRVGERYGATGGAALAYTAASLLLLATVGPTRIRDVPRRYLAVGGPLFVAYELCLALSIGQAHGGRQAIEVGMVNYLWPAFTMASAILFNGQRANWLMVPGVGLAIAGVCRVLGGERGFDAAALLANVGDNPFSYGLSFAGTLVWAAYCTVTARLAGGKNAITLFFMLTALALWAKYLAFGGAPLDADPRGLADLALAAAAMGFGYAAWNVGLLRGHVTVLAGASYFIPVLSAALASYMLRAPLSPAFWQGAFLVCGGSILCWLATRAGRA